MALERDQLPRPVAGFVDIIRAFSARRGSIFPSISIHVFVCAAIGAWSCFWVSSNSYSYGFYFHSMISVGVGLMLVFRSQIAYGRFWEGRGAFGELLVALKAMAQLVDTGVNIQDASLQNSNSHTAQNMQAAVRMAREKFQTLLLTYMWVVVAELRTDDLKDAPYASSTLAQLSPHMQEKIKNTPLSVAACISHELQLHLAACHQMRIAHPSVLQQGTKRMYTLLTAYAACKKLQTTSVPVPYSQMCSWLVLMYCYTAPFTFATAFSSETSSYVGLMARTVICSMFVSVTYFGVNQTAIELEDPFGDDANDLPLVALGQCAAKDLNTIIDTNRQGLVFQEHFIYEQAKAKERERLGEGSKDSSSDNNSLGANRHLPRVVSKGGGGTHPHRRRSHAASTTADAALPSTSGEDNREDKFQQGVQGHSADTKAEAHTQDKQRELRHKRGLRPACDGQDDTSLAPPSTVQQAMPLGATQLMLTDPATDTAVQAVSAVPAMQQQPTNPDHLWAALPDAGAGNAGMFSAPWCAPMAFPAEGGVAVGFVGAQPKRPPSKLDQWLQDRMNGTASAPPAQAATTTAPRLQA